MKSISILFFLVLLVDGGSAIAHDSDEIKMLIVSKEIYQFIINDFENRLNSYSACKYCDRQGLADAVMPNSNWQGIVEKAIEKYSAKNKLARKFVHNNDRKNVIVMMINSLRDTYSDGYINGLEQSHFVENNRGFGLDMLGKTHKLDSADRKITKFRTFEEFFCEDAISKAIKLLDESTKLSKD